jgi:hypothetical protein
MSHGYRDPKRLNYPRETRRHPKGGVLIRGRA